MKEYRVENIAWQASTVEPPFLITETQTLENFLNGYAKGGWTVKCFFNTYLILERDVYDI